MQINLRLTELLTYLMEESWHPDGRGTQLAQAAAGQQKVDLLKVKEYVDLHYAEPLTLESLAGDFYFSKHYLARCFKEQFGTTVNGYMPTFLTATVRLKKSASITPWWRRSRTFRSCVLEAGGRTWVPGIR